MSHVVALEFIAAMLCAFTLSAWLTSRFSRPGSRFYILDHPGERSLHREPVPRSGGAAIVIAIFAAGVLLNMWYGEIPVGLPWLAAAWLLAAGIGLADDRCSLTVLLRLLVHGSAAALLIMGGFAPEHLDLPGVVINVPRGVTLSVTWLFIVWMINLYNFMDGMDGFAGGMACIGFSALALLGLFAGHNLFAALSLIVAGAALGFLCFNFPPARIFMGDMGAYSLGLLAAGFTLWGMRDGVFAFWVPVLIFSPFIVDATVTLARRTLHGEPVWKAHRTHFYQLLVQRGFGHRNTVLGHYVLMVACALCAVTAAQFSPLVQWSMIVFWMAAYVMLIGWVVSRCYLSVPE